MCFGSPVPLLTSMNLAHFVFTYERRQLLVLLLPQEAFTINYERCCSPGAFLSCARQAAWVAISIPKFVYKGVLVRHFMTDDIAMAFLLSDAHIE